ncbi:MAG TPA: FeoA family protein [Bacillota bacterium]|nr:FeoA family protein [Bacillota bacterium]
MNILKYIRLSKKDGNPPGENKETSGFGNGINLTQLENGEVAKVVKNNNKNAIKSKLEAMGIITGTIIRKKSTILAKGPIVIEKDRIQVAIGYAEAKKMIVEPVPIDMGSDL